jgi:hypothetical protein
MIPSLIVAPWSDIFRVIHSKPPRDDFWLMLKVPLAHETPNHRIGQAQGDFQVARQISLCRDFLGCDSLQKSEDAQTGHVHWSLSRVSGNPVSFNDRIVSGHVEPRSAYAGFWAQGTSPLRRKGRSCDSGGFSVFFQGLTNCRDAAPLTRFHDRDQDHAQNRNPEPCESERRKTRIFLWTLALCVPWCANRHRPFRR